MPESVFFQSFQIQVAKLLEQQTEISQKLRVLTETVNNQSTEITTLENKYLSLDKEVHTLITSIRISDAQQAEQISSIQRHMELIVTENKKIHSSILILTDNNEKEIREMKESIRELNQSVKIQAFRILGRLPTWMQISIFLFGGFFAIGLLISWIFHKILK